MRPPVLNDPDIGTMFGSLVPLRGEFEPRGVFTSGYRLLNNRDLVSLLRNSNLKRFSELGAIFSFDTEFFHVSALNKADFVAVHLDYFTGY